jgi:hypothetical protein
VLREANRTLHAKEPGQRLVEDRLHATGKTPVTSVATSLKGDSRSREFG